VKKQHLCDATIDTSENMESRHDSLLAS